MYEKIYHKQNIAIRRKGSFIRCVDFPVMKHKWVPDRGTLTENAPPLTPDLD
jgi:hypothetical protein